MEVSSIKNAIKEPFLFELVALGWAVYVQNPVHIAKVVAALCKVSPGVQFLLISVLKRLDPIMIQTIKHEKIIPRGTAK